MAIALTSCGSEGRLRFAGGGETASSRNSTGELAKAVAREGARGGTMGSPTRNLCRCTGYHNIVKAVLAAAEVT